MNQQIKIISLILEFLKKYSFSEPYLIRTEISYIEMCWNFFWFDVYGLYIPKDNYCIVRFDDINSLDTYTYHISMDYLLNSI